MGVNNSRKSNEQPMIDPQKPPVAPTRLIKKLHGNLQKNRNSSSSSENINTSNDTSGRNKKKLFKRLSGYEKSSSNISLPIDDSATLFRCNSNPMIAAAAKVSDHYENLNRIGSSKDHCLITQPITSRLSKCQILENDDNDDDQFELNKVQSNKPISVTLLKKNDSTLNQQQDASLDTNLIEENDLVSDFYLRPGNEADRRKQKDRQQRLHYLLKHIWKGIYRADLDEPKTIVDWCCGIGVWDIEMSLLFPKAQIIGVDFKDATLSNLQHEYPNIKFKHVVIHNDSTGLENFESNSVDFVMMRDVWFINAPPSKWINVLKEAFRILKPGGWIEITEHSLSVLSPGPCTVKINYFFQQFFKEARVETAIAVKLYGYLKDIGYVDIDKVSKAVPLGEWETTNALKQTGYLSRDWLERGFRNLSRWVCDINHIDPTEINQLITKSMEEELDENHSFMEWTSYVARKGPISIIPSSKNTPIIIHPPTPPADNSSIYSANH